jgi:hypothetical protein
MATPVKTTTFAERAYRVQLLGGDTADEMLFRLGRGLVLQDLSPSDFKWAKGVFFDRIQVGIVDKDGSGKTNYIPLSSIYNDEYVGPEGRKALGHLLQFSWEVNFGNFFDVLRDLARARKVAVSGSVSPKGADGASGGSSPPIG